MFRRRTVHILLCLLGLFLLGTVVVLSSISYYLSIDTASYLTEVEIPPLPNGTRWNATDHGMVERIPRIIHQTWKSETLPAKWKNVSQGCRDIAPDYEYMLWTDTGSREFIAENYPWFLDTFDGYTYPIQRADAIRYFVLHHFGGIYIDLDIGCIRPLDQLLAYPVILPRTIPVGVSNDLMFAEKGHPFMAQTIHNLVTFDHSWFLNYPTVMFSTGPMFLSAQYGLYTASHPPTSEQPGGEVRILPKALYGKNAKPGEAPHTFFEHFYGSSWHADDAAFIGFLGTWGKGLMWIGLVVLILGILRLAFSSRTKQRQYGLRRIGGYDVMVPRWTQRNGRWYLDLGWFALPATSSANQPISPIELSGALSDEEDVLPLAIGSRAVSPTPSDTSMFPDASDATSTSYWAAGRPLLDAVRQRGGRMITSFFGTNAPEEPLATPPRSRRRRSRGVLFFLPAFFTPSQGVELPIRRSLHSRSSSRSLASASYAPPEYPSDKARYADDLESAGLLPAAGYPGHQRVSSPSSDAGSSTII